MFALILRVYSYLYHLVLCFFLLGLAVVAMNSSSTLSLEMLPWSGSDLVPWLLWGSLAGILSVILAMTGIFRFLFPIWALTVLVMMVRGFLLKPYTFEGKPDFVSVIWLIGGALLAFLASLTVLRARRSRRA